MMPSGIVYLLVRPRPLGCCPFTTRTRLKQAFQLTLTMFVRALLVADHMMLYCRAKLRVMPRKSGTRCWIITTPFWKAHLDLNFCLALSVNRPSGGQVWRCSNCVALCCSKTTSGSFFRCSRNWRPLPFASVLSPDTSVRFLSTGLS